MTHVVLLGDSIFDNGAYVPGEPDVVRQLRPLLPTGWRATLIAVDGDVTTDVPRQLKGVPADASHLVVSVGGNDALQRIGVFEERAASVADAVKRLSAVAGGFERNYEAMLNAVGERDLPTALCTIYNPRFPDPRLQALAVAGLSVFNDAILRAAIARGLPVLELRLICDRVEDYANPIEPSAKGGAKIAAAIARLLREHDFRKGRTEVFAR
jgi:hypothetical protein